METLLIQKNSKDRSLILGSIKIAKQVETLSLQKNKNSKDRNHILGSIKITEQVETLTPLQTLIAISFSDYPKHHATGFRASYRLRSRKTKPHCMNAIY